MNTDEFIDNLSHLSPEEIGRAATTLRTAHDSASGEIAWWEGELAVTGVLRASDKTMAARSAARRASDAVMRASRAAQLTLSREEIRSVAHGAADIAEALIAGDSANAQAEYLLDRLGWLEHLPPNDASSRSILFSAA